MRRLRVPGDEREQEVHADPADEHGEVRPGDRRMPHRPHIDQGRRAAQLDDGPDAEQHHRDDGEARRHGEVPAPRIPFAGEEQHQEQCGGQDDRACHVHVGQTAFGGFGHGTPRGQEGGGGDDQAEAVGGPYPASTDPPVRGEVVLGMDTHGEAHAASVASPLGKVVVAEPFPATAAGCRCGGHRHLRSGPVIGASVIRERV
ncbi:hypothetical protein GCM10011578_091200 [Streptomyces fuscichromogenes]|uniref:Uncharacterized protein n=1 Tax=Streptomyces fuscichromogenes TaxID=1324013 RepID=A0A918CX36_9ACTN|nr:hypothetical protein GCM10011578_091200 [Streptomyces fuscichromogenes]